MISEKDRAIVKHIRLMFCMDDICQSMTNNLIPLYTNARVF